MKQRSLQFIFIVSLLTLSWLGMMAVHELGHATGALLSGGTVERIVVHPLTISRTDVSPNPNPLFVVWMGPVFGCVIPLLLGLLVPKQSSTIRPIAMFFAGFCLLANGAYIAVGSIDKVGDCGEMLKHGSPRWALVVFGTIAIAMGFFLWHRLGSPKQFLAEPQLVDSKMAYVTLLSASVLVGACFLFSPM